MNKFSKVALLLLVLAPSIFFISRAFASNEAVVAEEKLIVSGPGGFKLPLALIQEVSFETTLPSTSGTEGFSLGWIKKGDFIRTSDQKNIRIIKNHDQGFIHLTTTGKEIYFNLETQTGTEKLFDELQKAIEQ